MSRQLILEDLIVKLSEKADVTPEAAADFLRAFISNAGGAISADHQLEVDNLGTFTVNENINGEKTVVFIPDDEVADAINAPFALFDAVELNDGVNLAPEVQEEISPLESATESEPVSVPMSETEREPKPACHPAPAIEETVTPEPPAYNPPVEHTVTPPQAPVPPVVNPSVTPQPASNIRIEVVTTPQPQPQAPAPVQQPVEPAQPATVVATDELCNEVEQYKRKSIFCCRALCAIIVIILVIGAYFFGLFTPAISEWAMSHIQDNPAPGVKLETEAVSPVPVETSTVTKDTVEAETAPVKEIKLESNMRLDTVKADYYFTHMARRYYGNNAFWSYIYKENEDKLGNPDYTKVGTVVVIPPAAKYEIDANNPESIKKAKQLGYEIYRDNKGKK